MKEKALDILSELNDSVQDMRENGETDLRTVIHQIERAFSDVQNLPESEEKGMNIYQKLVEVRKAVPYLQKNAQGQQFNYVSSSAVLGAVRHKLDDLGVLLISRILNKSVNEREKVNAKGNTVVTYEISLDLEFTWVNAENPEETIVIPFFTMGLDTGDNAKAVGKAVTYGEKYFLLKQFNIATDQDDPDRFQERTESSVRETVSNDQVKELEVKAQEFADLRDQTKEAVFQALNIKDINKVTTSQMKKHMLTLETWITNAKKKIKGA